MHEEFEFSPNTWIDTRIMSGSTLDVKIHTKQHMQIPAATPVGSSQKDLLLSCNVPEIACANRS